MKRAWILVAVGVALCLPAATASAQTGAARGKVVDEQGQPIEGAKIELDYKGGVTRKYETKTNKKGEFTQVGLQSGMYEVTASKEGYQPGITGGRISLGDPTYLPEIKLRKLGAAGPAAGGGGGADAIRAAFQTALELTQAGKLDDAEAAYKDLLTKAPSIPEIHYNLGFVYTQKKDWANAEASFQKALELKPDYGDAISALVKVYQDAGQPDKAMALLSKPEFQNDPKVLFNLGVTHLNAGRDDDAIAAFKKVIELDPALAEAHYHLGTRYFQKSMVPEATAAFEKYLSLHPQNAQNVAAATALIQALKPKK